MTRLGRQVASKALLGSVTDMPEGGDGGIFISYRRQDSSDFAGRLYDRLTDRFGEGRVFMDVDTIEPGVDFAEAINLAVAACAVLVAVIGPGWLTSTDERGLRRLDNPDDLVRLEIETALARDVRVIPVLAKGANMPDRGDLPGSLARLVGRNALFIRHESFRSDAGRLIAAIERVMASAPCRGAGLSAPTGNVVGATAKKAPGPARNDLGRAARLLSEAEGLARSFFDKYKKAPALCTIASVLAATDPDRAERLLTEAERIAHRFDNKDAKAGALITIAGLLAATDPDRAERIARSLTHEYHRQERALRAVAKAVAATDPDRAERIGHSLTDEHTKADALGDIAGVLAATDPDRAERIAYSITITDEYFKASAVTFFTDEYFKASAVCNIAEVLAATDPDRAERIARSIADEYADSKASGLGAVAKALATTDPGRAERLLTEAERIAQSSSDVAHGPALTGVVEALAATDPDRAERMAHSIPEEFWHKRSLISVAQALAATDPDRAERIARSFANTDAKAEALSAVAKALAATDPGRAERDAHSITIKSWQIIALCGIAEVLTSTEPVNLNKAPVAGASFLS